MQNVAKGSSNEVEISYRIEIWNEINLWLWSNQQNKDPEEYI